MPRTDPVTGCQVLTMPEFWQSEAEREGKGREPWELEAEMYQDLADDEERCRQDMLNDTKAAYKNLLDYWNLCREDIDWDELDPLSPWREEGKVDFFILYKPRRVIEVLHAELDTGFKETSGRIVSRVLFSGGRVKIVSFGFWSFSGDMIDPPDADESVDILPDDWEPENDDDES